MTSKHTDDDRWLAALAGQAEPDDAQTRQAASLRRYLELQDEREAPLERRAAGRMARRLQAGLAAAQAGHADPSTQAPQTSPAAHTTPAHLVDLADLAAATGQTAPMPLPAARVSGWSRVRAWCFPPVQGHGGHYAGAGALAVVLATGLILAPGWWSRSEAPAQADERLAMAEPTRQIGAQELARDSLSTSRMVLPPTVASADVPPVAPLVAPPAEQDAARAKAQIAGPSAAPVAATTAATGAVPGAAPAAAPGAVPIASPAAEAGRTISAAPVTAPVTAHVTTPAPVPAPVAPPAAAAITAEASAKAATADDETRTARLDRPSVRGLVDSKPAAPVPPLGKSAAPTLAAAAPPAATAPPAAAGANAPRQHLTVPRPADAAAQIEELLRQQDVTYAMRISPDDWLLDADVPAARRQALIEPLRRFRLELPADGKLRVRITPAH